MLNCMFVITIAINLVSGQICLPDDGSVVPDCSSLVDPVTKQPYFERHSFSMKYAKVQNDLIVII